MAGRTEKGHSLKYMELYDNLKKEILEGKFLTGSFLPTESELMEQNQISRTTVRRALALLQKDELVTAVQGRGTQVNKGRSQTYNPRYRVPYEAIRIEREGVDDSKIVFSSSTIDKVMADIKIAEKMNVPMQTEVYRIQRLKFVEEIPFSYVVSYVPCEPLPDFERFNGEVFWLNKCLYEQYHLQPLSAEEIISIKSATFMKANLLQVKIGSPLFLSQRTAVYEKDVIEYTENYYNPDYCSYHIFLEGRPEYFSMEGDILIED